ncbi:Uncharacterised protein [Mycobacteroides abscessus subsp. abscessus]|uniref:hypothetical protein n=1 Tax=Mycobacteroides TaxID=670516 RepID=UPI000929FD26|nr:MULTISPECIES: hypothetical protein [Mycobacteroides]MCV7306712.1 hypothetical protein [Mycobacteroides immunogenum]SIC79505.1 Uncharacterised protein [Mycobacteroides abscessus subsp. abscessus]SIE43836.1 Uncharacterised protein [Mycobacteroides abscessus subsp. abscessus]SIE73813.1 Uncharacterised protein [Mycobacteroides abscessus subsp. abscessus]SIF50917.1 Uncharacterised protein [Mycobacteroides abscessus subsp. abscessus]
MTPDLLEHGEDRRPPAAAGTAAPDNQSMGSPWDTDVVNSWVSPYHQKNKE